MSAQGSARAAAPGRPIRVLHLEDRDDDVRLVARELERGGFAPSVRVEDTAEGMRAALAAEPFDLLISDYSMPTFDAPAALAIARALVPDVPFIVVSGSVGEQEGVEVMRGGAADYFPKTALTRLPAAVERELDGARRRRAGRRELRDRDFLVRAGEVLTASLDFERTLALPVK